MIKIIYFAFCLGEAHELQLNTWVQCLDMAETIHKLQPDYAVFCCRDGECEEVEFQEVANG